MFNKALSSAVVALAASRFVSAQTFTDCNPMEKTCDPDPAFGNESVDCDFTQGECSAFEELPGTTISYDGKGALFKIEKESNAPTIATHKRIFFGELEVELQAAEGQGIVTSVVLESKDLDEIDWEWVGGDNAQVQSNYYGKGDTTTYDRAEYHPIDAPLTSTHKYKIQWTSKAINWIIDGSTIRTVTYDEAKGGSRFPQTPMEVKIGTWVGGGKNSAPGTVEWAGGYTDFSQAPFNAWYKSVKIVDYAGKDSPSEDEVKEYVWTDKTGSWESIKVVKGDGSSDDGDDDNNDDDDKTTTKPESSKTAEPTKSKTDSDDEATSTPESSSTPTASESTATTPTPSTSGSEETGGSGSPTSSAPGDGASEVPEDAATGVFASFGRVAAAGAAAVLVAQLF